MIKTYALKYDETKFKIDLVPFKEMKKFDGIKRINSNTFISCDINLLLYKSSEIKAVWTVKRQLEIEKINKIKVNSQL